MNSGFSERILADELSKLSSTRQSIQTLSYWCIFHRKNAEQVVQMWDNKFHSSPKEKKIIFLYLANDILQNGRHTGPEFVDKFWRVLPAALQDVTKNGSDYAKHAVSRLVNIWVERKVFGSRSRELRDSILGNEPPPALGLNKNRSGGSVIRDSRTVRTELSTGGTEEKFSSAFHIVISQPNENVEMNKCKNAVRRVGKLEKNINYACGRVGDPWKETLVIELREQETTLKQCLEKLKSVEASRAALVSQLKEALEEQESALENVRTQIQVAEGTLENAANIQRQLNNETVVTQGKRPVSAEASERNSNYPPVQPQNSAATIEAPDKRMRLEEPMQFSDPSAAAAFMPVQEVAFSAPHQPQTVPVQQTPIQNQASASQPQHNIYQFSTMQYLEPTGGAMIRPFDSYSAPPPAALPLPQMTNMTGTEFFIPQQQQQQSAGFQPLPSPMAPPPMPVNQPLPINQQPIGQPMPINQQPIGQPMPINQQPAQFNIPMPPLPPSYHPLLPDSMGFYYPQYQ